MLIEHDYLTLSELSAILISDGRKGDNLIKDYDQVSKACAFLTRSSHSEAHFVHFDITCICVSAIQHVTH